VSRIRISVVAVLALALLVPRTQAQSLTTGLFDRYLDALRQELGIPGLSAAVVQNGNVVWERGFGLQDVAQAVPATPDTPYPIANLSETIGATLLLRECVDQGRADLSDRVIRWIPYPDNTTTLSQVLSHTSSTGTYGYDPVRFGVLNGVVSECSGVSYTKAVANDLLERLAMSSSIPGRDALRPPMANEFPEATIAAYNSVLGRMATPYRVDSVTGKATRSDYTSPDLDAATGMISSAHDLARFDAALSDGALVSPELLSVAWQPSPRRPTGLGWFVQTSDGEKLVWHFGVAKDAYSSLILKVPSRGLTLVLLANSDRLASSLNTAQPDVTQSIFARLFLKLFVV
jgi:CubicO group peptidase (beta-lactamase class C family)